MSADLCIWLLTCAAEGCPTRQVRRAASVAQAEADACQDGWVCVDGAWYCARCALSLRFAEPAA